MPTTTTTSTKTSSLSPTTSTTTTRRPTAKTLQLLAAIFTIALVAAACGGDDDITNTLPQADCEINQIDGDLAIYNWAEYIDETLLEDFSNEYNTSVTLDVYDSNEAMQPIIAAGNSGYSLIVPSDYMVKILIAGSDIQPLNKSAIPNLSHVSSDFQDLVYDPDGDFSVPYQWGTTGLAVDTAAVGTDFPRSWGLVFDDSIAGQYSGQISLLNDPRETMGAALKYLGYSLNTTSEAELNEATQLVADARSNLAAFNTDSADELLTTGETVIAHGYSGDMFTQFLETDDPSRYVYFVPEEGGTRWIDNMAIPHDAPSPCTAHTFINWLLNAEQGATLSNYNYYGSPNTAALPGLDDELFDFITDPQVAPVDVLESIIDTGDFEVNFSDAFIEAKG